MQPKLQKALGCEKGNLDRVVPRSSLSSGKGLGVVSPNQTHSIIPDACWRQHPSTCYMSGNFGYLYATTSRALTRLSYPSDVAFHLKAAGR
jgi:hypothetical protein